VFSFRMKQSSALGILLVCHVVSGKANPKWFLAETAVDNRPARPAVSKARTLAARAHPATNGAWNDYVTVLVSSENKQQGIRSEKFGISADESISSEEGHDYADDLVEEAPVPVPAEAPTDAPVPADSREAGLSVYHMAL